MLYESAEALPLVYAVDNLATARAEQARSPAQLNAIRHPSLVGFLRKNRGVSPSKNAQFLFTTPSDR
jgi:hypothetical protein